MGVVVRRYMYIYIDFLIILLTATPLVLALFFSSIPTTSLFIFKCFLFRFMIFLSNIANVAQRTCKIIQKLRSRRHGDIIILTRTCASRLRVQRLPCAKYRVTFQESCS